MEAVAANATTRRHRNTKKIGALFILVRVVRKLDEFGECVCKLRSATVGRLGAFRSNK